jgi:hypothetical protein
MSCLTESKAHRIVSRLWVSAVPVVGSTLEGTFLVLNASRINPRHIIGTTIEEDSLLIDSARNFVIFAPFTLALVVLFLQCRTCFVSNRATEGGSKSIQTQ